MESVCLIMPVLMPPWLTHRHVYGGEIFMQVSSVVNVYLSLEHVANKQLPNSRDKDL